MKLAKFGRGLDGPDVLGTLGTFRVRMKDLSLCGGSLKF